jgi:hypothetical protein
MKSVASATTARGHTPTVIRAYFPLRSSVELFRDPASPRPITRAKEAAILFDELIFEDGLFEASLNPEGSFQQYRTSDRVTDEDRQRARVIPEPGSRFRLDVRVEPESGGPPIALPPASGKLIGHYAAEWMTGVTDELDQFKLDWVRKVVMAEQDLAESGLTPIVAAVADDLGTVGAAAYDEPITKGFAMGALARDLVVAGALDATVQVTTLFEPLLTAQVDAIRARSVRPGAAALGIVVPDVASLRWDAILEFRDHAASREARGRLRQIEERALSEDPRDAAEFQRRVGIEVTNELFAVIDDLEGSLELDVAICDRDRRRGRDRARSSPSAAHLASCAHEAQRRVTRIVAVAAGLHPRGIADAVN